MLNWKSIAARLLAFSSILSIADFAVAQVPAAPPPVREVVDANGVDLLTGEMTSVYSGPSIGPAGGFGFNRHFRGGGTWDSYIGAITCDVGECSVIMDGTTDKFASSGSVFTPVENNGATLTVSGGTHDGTYTYTTSNGTVAVFEAGTADYTHTYPATNRALLSTVTYPNGERVSVEHKYKTETVCDPQIPSCTLVELTSARVKSLISNRGYKLSVTYRENSSMSTPEFFFLPKQVAVSNLADGTVVGSVGMTQTRTTAGSYLLEMTDDLGRVTKYRITYIPDRGITSITKPGSTAADITVHYTSSDRVSYVDNGGVITHYDYSDATGSLPFIRTTTVTRTGGGERVLTFDLTNERLLSDSDELNRTTTYHQFFGG